MEDKIREMIVRQLGTKELETTQDAELVNDLGMDSLDVVELAMAFEEEFGVEIPDEDVEGWKTVGDVITYLEGKG